jgi:hypothetical protein
MTSEAFSSDEAVRPEIGAACYKMIPGDQKVVLTVGPSPVGGMLRAKTIGRMISEMGKLLEATARECGAPRERTFVTGIAMDDDGAVSVEFACLPPADPT